MPIPKYDQLLRPILSLATKQDITGRDITNVLADQFSLTNEERNARISSGGSTYIRNRTGWAMTFLTKARLIEKVAKATYRATPFGHTFLEAHPTEIKESDLEQIDGWKEAWADASKRRAEAKAKRAQIVESQDPEAAGGLVTGTWDDSNFDGVLGPPGEPGTVSKKGEVRIRGKWNDNSSPDFYFERDDSTTGSMINSTGTTLTGEINGSGVSDYTMIFTKQ